jgi:hypothetical protein
MAAGMAAGEGEGHEEVLSESDFALSKLNRALEFLAVASEPHPSPARLRLLVKMEVEAGKCPTNMPLPTFLARFQNPCFRPRFLPADPHPRFQGQRCSRRVGRCVLWRRKRSDREPPAM